MADDADNVYFKAFLSMVPAHYLSPKEEAKDDNTGADQRRMQSGESQKPSKKRKRQASASNDTNPQEPVSAIDEKIKGKKDSKQKRKKKPKENSESQASIQEAQEKLQARIAELQAKRAHNLTSEEMQERKRLERQQRKLKGRKKQKNKKKKGEDVGTVQNGSGGPNPVAVIKPAKPIVTKEGKLVFSKFDFTQSGAGKQSRSSDLTGKDYKRILARLEQRNAKVAKMKETDAEAASKLEQKHVWMDVMSKAKGEKVKDDASKVKKALKRKEKLKEKRKEKWQDRKASQEKHMSQKQEKREHNLQKRRDEKKAKIRKRMIKKGRILPGF